MTNMIFSNYGLSNTNFLYSICKTQLNRDLMVACQKRYRTAKKRAKCKYKDGQKRKLRELSELNPRKF